MTTAERNFMVESLARLEAKMLEAEMERSELLASLHIDQQNSGRNLLHYLAFRCEDIREMQDALHDAGLSSLASSESHILKQTQSVLERLGHAAKRKPEAPCDFHSAKRLIQHRSINMFGRKSHPGIPHLMVTFDTDFAFDYRKVHQLLQAGMNVARINCAHDDPIIWQEMIANVRKAAEATGTPCSIYLDLAGPKIRTEILGRGRKKGRAKLEDVRTFFLAERDAHYPDDQVVIGCSTPGIVAQLQPGERVFFDDGLFEARVVKVRKGIAQLHLLRISAKKPILQAEKGINFPDSDISVDCLTEEDRAVLPFALEHADLLGYSFVRTPAELRQLQEILEAFPDKKSIPTLVIKIETPEAVRNLPALLFQGMRYPNFGVMIARGDLAVEIGFERMSEIQEEILWICEAAHIPVIWATQVLENLNKSGIATRSEITDAAHAAMAECVMVNKGAHILRVIDTLKDILLRSGGHHIKKTYTLRPLSIASRFIGR